MVPVKISLGGAYQPLRYDRYLGVAPGILLIKAPCHSLGSQTLSEA